jgi:outer membrane protein OmpA-like peptidoglycan-associated protein
MISAPRAPFHMTRRGRVFVLSAASVLFAIAGAGAQSDIRAQIFRDASEARTRANQVNADFLAPRSFERGTAAYARADNLFSHQKPLDEIREQIRLAAQNFTQAVEAGKTAQTEFAATLKARADAISSDAAHLSPGLWDNAEKILLSAAASLEDGDASAARKEAAEAHGIYKSAELEAIKLSLLTPAHELLVRAEKLEVRSTAPETMKRAYQFLELAEAMVKQNRYDVTEARRLAGEAKYEAAHAIYLHEIISQMQEHTTTFEDAILLSETAIGRIASALNTRVRFDGGYEPVVQQIITAVKSRDSARATLAENFRHLRTENAALHRHHASPEPRSGTTNGPSPDAARKAEEEQRINSAVALARTFFDPRECAVLRDGDNVVLQVFGLTFSPENSALASGSFELLSKIEHAIRLFPNCRLAVEAHTETGENETLNQKNSEKCAATVAAYLKKSPSESPLIDSRGWGSSSPIAESVSADGHARNKRIDVVISPE